LQWFESMMTLCTCACDQQAEATAVTVRNTFFEFGRKAELHSGARRRQLSEPPSFSPKSEPGPADSSFQTPRELREGFPQLDLKGVAAFSGGTRSMPIVGGAAAAEAAGGTQSSLCCWEGPCSFCPHHGPHPLSMADGSARPAHPSVEASSGGLDSWESGCNSHPNQACDEGLLQEAAAIPSTGRTTLRAPPQPCLSSSAQLFVPSGMADAHEPSQQQWQMGQDAPMQQQDLQQQDCQYQRKPHWQKRQQRKMEQQQDCQYQRKPHRQKRQQRKMDPQERQQQVQQQHFAPPPPPPPMPTSALSVLQAWQPHATELTDLCGQVVECMRLMLEACAEVACAQGAFSYKGWSLTAYVIPESLKTQRGRLDQLARRALTLVVEKVEQLVLVGYDVGPFSPMPHGFGAALVPRPNEKTACLGSFAQGFCANPGACKKEHPAVRVGVQVLLKQARHHQQAGK